MKNLISSVIVIIAISGCHKARQETPPRLRNPPIPSVHSLAPSGEGKLSDPRLADLENKMNAAHREAPHLVFKADLTRQVGGKDQTSYVAFVEMKPGKVMTSIFLPGPETLRIAEVVGLTGKEPEITDMLGDEMVDSCLFGTLTVSWIGPTEIAEPPYTGRVLGGQFEGIVRVKDQPCYQVSYKHGDENEIVEVYYIDATTFFLCGWESFHYLPLDTIGKPWMVVTRKYRELEPAVLSAETETVKGENR
jgi:hypothetical protein